MNIEELNRKLMAELTLEEYQKLSCVMFETLDRFYGLNNDRKPTRKD